MIISSNVFEAYLKCPSECWFSIRGEITTDNVYFEWLQKQNPSYLAEGLKAHNSDFLIAPSRPVNIKKAKWRLATDILVRKDNLEARVHAIERLTPDGKSLQLIPKRFVSGNKISKLAKRANIAVWIFLFFAFWRKYCEVVRKCEARVNDI